MEIMPEIENMIINNIFSQEQIDYIYNVVNSTTEDDSIIQTRMGHRAWFINFDASLITHLESIIHNRFENAWHLNAVQFARYSNEYGYQTKLYPHYDDAFDRHKLTLDIQIKANTSWPIVVEGKSFTLKDNQGLVFSGTDQIHWREDKQLKDGEFLDMMFCHLEKDIEVSLEWREHMMLRQQKWEQLVNISKDEIKLKNF